MKISRPPENPDTHLKLCWSVNNEDFTYESLEDLLNSEAVAAGRFVYFGEAKPPKSSQIIDSDDVIEFMRDRAWDLVGEYAADFPDVSNDAKTELDQFLTAWIGQHASITFFTVQNIKERQITEADIESAIGDGTA